MLPTFSLVAGFASLSLLPLSSASPPDVTFLCNRMPEVCTNMCWAVRCAQPRFPQTLTWDRPTEGKKEDRRASAGCKLGNNKCNKGRSGVGHRGPPNTSCDEYPFATTSQSTYPNGHQVSRCVPQSQNSAQGNALKQVYRKYKQQGLSRHRLKINFGNPGSSGVKYCLNQACRNDGFEVQDKTIKRRDEDPDFHFYTTLSGVVLASIEPDNTPSNYTRIVDPSENLAADLETWWEQIDDEGDDVEIVNDIILREISVEEVLAMEANATALTA